MATHQPCARCTLPARGRVGCGRALEAALPAEFGIFFPNVGSFLPLLPPPGLLEGSRKAGLLPAHTDTCTRMTCTRVTCTRRGGRSPRAVGTVLAEGSPVGTGGRWHCSFTQGSSHLPAGCILLLQQAGVRGAGVPGTGDRQQGGGLTRHQAGQGKGGLMHLAEVPLPGQRSREDELASGTWVLPKPICSIKPRACGASAPGWGCSPTATSPSLTSPPLPRQIVFVLSSALNPGNEGRCRGEGGRSRKWPCWSKAPLLMPAATLALGRDGGAPGEAR